MNEYLSRARVLEILQEIDGCDADPDTWADGWDKAIDEAYNRIESEPAVNNPDTTMLNDNCIDRQALINRLTSSGAICDFGLHIIKQFPALQTKE